MLESNRKLAHIWILVINFIIAGVMRIKEKKSDIDIGETK